MMSHPNSPGISPRKGKYLDAKVLMLDDNVEIFHVPTKALGMALFGEVVRKMQLLEADYFDLEFNDQQGSPCWLDHEKAILKQVSAKDAQFKFLVKFYGPDPGLLEEEYTRYLFALQVRRDLATGAMLCQEHTAVLLASYVVQAEIGDFDEDEYQDGSYLRHLKLLPHQSVDIEKKIMEHHKEHIGQTPAEAEFNLLDTARKVEMYGIRMHPAKDHEGVSLNLAIAHMGVLVFQHLTRINTFSWAKIRKLSFKRKKFLIKLHPEGYGYYKDTVEFYFDTRDECKNFWKKCIEHHAFFRCQRVKRQSRNRTRVVSRGSSFRYCGRTQKQLTEFVRENYQKRPAFERSQSMRAVSSSSVPRRTPNSSTLNSREMSHYGHNTTMSSHSLDRRSERNIMTTSSHSATTPLTVQQRLEMSAEIHDDSSGSRSPRKRLDMHLGDRSGSEEWNHYDVQEASERADKILREPGYARYQPQQQRIDPTQFMLSKEDRKFSAPVFSSFKPVEVEDPHMSRSPEMENIPRGVSETHEERMRQIHEQGSAPVFHLGQPQSPPVLDKNGLPTNQNGPSYPRSYSNDMKPPAYNEATHMDVMHSAHQLQNMRVTEEDPLPPPPPPIYMEETPREKSKGAKERREDMRIAGTNRSILSGTSIGLTSSVSLTSTQTMDSEEEARRKRFPADKAYYIAKELLMTERTYKKDLEVITVWFRNAVTKEEVLPESLNHLLFANLDPIYDFHCNFLKDIEQRLAMWEGKSNVHLHGDYQRIGDIILKNMAVLQLYRNYIDHHEDILQEIQTASRRSKQFEQVYKEFEGQKVCYLPLNTFLLKPAQRLLHLHLILERLVNHYSVDHSDYADCKVALAKMKEITSAFERKMNHLENMQKLIELQRDLVGIDTLVQNNREFIREGCLQKLSKKGYQQRMFFLFSDMLIYASRSASPTLQFKIHGQMPLKGMIVEQTDAVANSFTILSHNKCLPLAATSEEEKAKWMDDLQVAINRAQAVETDNKVLYPSLKSQGGSSDNLEDAQDEIKTPTTPDKQVQQHRANTTMHVCWHRNTSVSMLDHTTAIQNQLSGYLLRKFKNSNGWQKLWVVFTNFCLFFYKQFSDDFPLASLPLLGYSVMTPSAEDGIHKDYVFKLQFKNHVYFFRAESEYTFERWMEVINSATNTSQHKHIIRNGQL